MSVVIGEVWLDDSRLMMRRAIKFVVGDSIC